MKVPLRVDFAGGWLDVPAYAIQGAYIVNCTIDIFVSENQWLIPYGAGLGGSAARHIITGKDAVAEELKLGAGWQDAAIIPQTGLCVWESGAEPFLYHKANPSFLTGMALWWTGKSHDIANIAAKPRDYELIKMAADVARGGVSAQTIDPIHKAVRLSYQAQLKEGMDLLPNRGEIAKKYCGCGWGGYALYMFDGPIPSDMIEINGHIR